ncbi:hypothetical protein BV25DRAFT_1333770 [Artomyces pyxidatus]|uniref:Uncharacterized protein n=1 Tax=Artomyces pyxidatus TaxID=48021 RepID=A0ACB8SPN3_9AGAM|nr:hypothetical protein BV25DRAFT_1333770 [Artomyces pyxidatus]
MSFLKIFSSRWRASQKFESSRAAGGRRKGTMLNCAERGGTLEHRSWQAPLQTASGVSRFPKITAMALTLVIFTPCPALRARAASRFKLRTGSGSDIPSCIPTRT